MSFFDNFKKKNLIAAHRGYSSKYPENTMIAFENSVGKSDFIEFDVQLTKDYIPVIIHDETLQRTSNIEYIDEFYHRKPWYVHDFEYEELLKLDISSWFNANVKKIQRVSTLDEILTFAKDNNIYLNLELKDISFSNESLAFVDIVLSYIEKFYIKDKIIISSFNHDYLREIIKKDSLMQIAVLEYNFISENLVQYLKKLNAVAYHIDNETVTKELVKKLKDNDIFVNVYTVNDENRRKELFGMGVKAIFTDDLSSKD